MIITDKFAWFHAGKTGGDHFSTLMNHYYPEHIVFQHTITNPQKHIHLQKALEVYSDLIGDMHFAVNFRKFYTWIVSWNRHHFQHIYKRLHTKNQIELFDIVDKQTKLGCIVMPKVAQQLSNKIIANKNDEHIINMMVLIQDHNNWIKLNDNDDCFHRFLILSQHNTTHMIRQEYLLEDFYQITSQFFEPKKEILENSSTTNVNKTFPEISLSKDEIYALYKNNPKRYQLDTEIYGDSLY